MGVFKQTQPRRVRWAVPAAAVVITGAAVAAATVPSASAAPILPAKTPAQLLTDVASTKTIPPLTGTVVETTSLGLPQLPQVGNPTSLSSLLTGSHTVKVYWQDARHFRLAIPQSLSETDFIRNGSTAWLWNSDQNTAEKFTAHPADNSNKTAAAKKAAAKAIAKAKAKTAGLPDSAPLTPQQAASDVLAKVGKTTVVTTQSNVDVADQAAYQLVLAPKSAESTIGSVRIAIDGRTGVPLRLQVFGKGASTPAFQVGYTSISYTAPSAQNFAFTPPPGAKVTTPGAASSASKPSAPDMSGAGTYGTGWLTVAALPETALSGASGTDNPASPAPAFSTGSSSSAGNPMSGGSQEIMSALFGSAKSVSGSWGSGRLVHAGLLNILFTGGKMYIGAVDPGVLESAVGHVTASNG